MKNVQTKAVIFDMDGVLLDSETISWKTWELAAQELGLENIQTANEKCMGASSFDIHRILRSIYGENFDSEAFLKRTYELFFEIEAKDGIPLMPFVNEALEYLSKKYILALASSTRKVHVIRQLTNAGIIDYFKTITTGDMVKHSKPDPEIYLIACKSLNLQPKECAAIEDSPNGIKSAYNAGLKTIMIPDKILPDEDIKKISWKILSSLKEINTVL